MLLLGTTGELATMAWAPESCSYPMPAASGGQLFTPTPTSTGPNGVGTGEFPPLLPGHCDGRTVSGFHLGGYSQWRPELTNSVTTQAHIQDSDI